MKFSLKNNSGFSLIEILVSLVVLSIGLMGLAGLQIAGLKGANDAHFRTQASLIMMDLSDRMRANQDGVRMGKYRTKANFWTQLNCANTPATNCETGNCDGENLATFDKYVIGCDVKKKLPNGLLTIDCKGNCSATDLDTDSEINKIHEIEISWREAKQNKEDMTDGKDYNTRSIKLNIVP